MTSPPADGPAPVRIDVPTEKVDATLDLVEILNSISAGIENLRAEPRTRTAVSAAAEERLDVDQRPGQPARRRARRRPGRGAGAPAGARGRTAPSATSRRSEGDDNAGPRAHTGGARPARPHDGGAGRALPGQSRRPDPAWAQPGHDHRGARPLLRRAAVARARPAVLARQAVPPGDQRSPQPDLTGRDPGDPGPDVRAGQLARRSPVRRARVRADVHRRRLDPRRDP